eukprot:m.159248 g.159248  ORF g.159248 m.159248 type:complete len:281 (+) comp13366_c4_seq3:2975-3817(+)
MSDEEDTTTTATTATPEDVIVEHESGDEHVEKKEEEKDKDGDEDEEDLLQRIQSVSLSNGTLSCAFRDFEIVPKQLADRYGALTKRLDLSHNMLTCVDHLEQFTQLRELVLDNNSIETLVLPEPMLHLQTLSMNKNNIVDIDKLINTIQTFAPNLTFLSLLGNIACPNELVEKEETDYQRYRYLVLHSLPKLKFLDSRKVSAEECETAAQQGQFMRAVVLKEEDLEQQLQQQVPTPSQYTPLPNTTDADLQQHKGSVGRCKYVYYGKHSEGNRFIRNNDL